MKLAVYAYTATTALGPGREALWHGLTSARGGLVPCDFDSAKLTTWIGRVPGCEAVALPPALGRWACRNNRLAEFGLQQDGFIGAIKQALERCPADRVGLFLGTSTSGIGATEAAYRQAADGRLPAWFSYQHSHDYFSLCGYVRARLGLAGPAMTISTACASSAKVFAAAARAMAAGFCDMAVVGGVDSLCLTTLYGFNSLQLLSSNPCRPGDVARDGISIGEAAGFALVAPAADEDETPRVLGVGESSDAYHMAAPEPEGAGAELAIRRALASVALGPGDIDYINLHGTATPANDLSEARAVARVFADATLVSSTKGATGHTLGAAGIVEAVIGWLALRHGWLPPSLNTRDVDPAITAPVLLAGQAGAPRHVLSNTFGFGGSNCCLILG